MLLGVEGELGAIRVPGGLYAMVGNSDWLLWRETFHGAVSARLHIWRCSATGLNVGEALPAGFGRRTVRVVGRTGPWDVRTLRTFGSTENANQVRVWDNHEGEGRRLIALSSPT